MIVKIGPRTAVVILGLGGASAFLAGVNEVVRYALGSGPLLPVPAPIQAAATVSALCFGLLIWGGLVISATGWALQRIGDRSMLSGLRAVLPASSVVVSEELILAPNLSEHQRQAMLATLQLVLHRSDVSGIAIPLFDDGEDSSDRLLVATSANGATVR